MGDGKNENRIHSTKTNHKLADDGRINKPLETDNSLDPNLNDVTVIVIRLMQNRQKIMKLFSNSIDTCIFLQQID